MRKVLASLTLLGSLAICSPAIGAQQTVFDGVGADGTGALTCTVQNAAPVAGQRWCGSSSGQATPISAVGSFDDTPIDVSVVLPPAPASGTDGNFPVIGVFHGYGSQKYDHSNPSFIQRWVQRGYAVMTPTTRGFWGSCGVKVPNPKPAACANGFIHLLANGVEVRDMQHLFGLLADEGVISPTRIGVTGQSYGGGMSLQLAALKNRISDENGTLTPWKSPLTAKDMSIAAAAPDFGWSNLVYGLIPNGAFYDYAALNPYRGPNGDRRAGVAKQYWVERLFQGGAQTGFYSSTDPKYDVPGIRAALGTNTPAGGPYDGNATVQNAINQLSSQHSGYGTDDSVAPSPTMLSQGWNDDLFPVSEALRYYNKTREKFPEAPLNLWAFDYGHTPRSNINFDNVTSLFAAQGFYMDFYVRGLGSAPEDPAGGVNVIASGCASDASNAAPTSTALVHAESWADLAQGELSLSKADSATIPAQTAVNEPFQGDATTICTTAATGTSTGAEYVLPAQSADYTIAGAATVIADLTVAGANDQLIARLYDVDPATSTQRLIARTPYRPVGTGTAQAVFQLSPQMWKVVQGHQLKLELLTTDSPYVLAASGQAPVAVKNLTLRVPTLDSPGAAGGAVKAFAEKILPAGYTLGRDFKQAPAPLPTTTPIPTPPYAVPTPIPPGPPPGGVGKVRPGLSLKVKPKRDRAKPFRFTASGKVNRKRAAKGPACRGRVKITVKKGKKTLANKTARVKGNCSYKAKVKLSNKKAGRKGTAKFTARFGGNSVLKAKSAKKSAKYGAKKKKKSKSKR